MLKIRRNILKLRNPETSEFESINGLLDGGNEDSLSKYDADNNGIVDDSERLGGKTPDQYASSDHTHTEYAPADHSHEETDPTILGWAKKDSEYEVTGNPITLENFEHMPMNVVTTFEPKQEGSGDPYPAGGGNQMIQFMVEGVTETMNGVTSKVTNDGVVLNGTPGSAYSAIKRVTLNLDPGTYYLSHASTDASVIAQINRTNADGTVTFISNSQFTITGTEQAVALLIQNNNVINALSDVVIRPMLNKGSSAAAFELYSNIRPITGYDKPDLNHAGKNLIDTRGLIERTDKGVTFTPVYDDLGRLLYINANGTATDGNAYYYCTSEQGYKMVLPVGETVTISGADVMNGLGHVDVQSADYDTVNVADYGSGRTVVLSYDGPYGIYITIRKGNTVNNVKIRPQVELGSTATSYAPYQGTLHTIQIAETIYGGKFDWLTGKFRGEWGFIELNGTETMSLYTSTYAGNSIFVRNVLSESLHRAEGFCSHFPIHNYIDTPGTVIIGNETKDLIFAGAIDVLGLENTTTAFATYLASQHAAGTPVQIVYKLTTPLEIQLDPTQIKALQGTNTFYGDGTITVSGDKNLHTLVSTVCKSVPTPSANDSEKFLRGDGTWSEVSRQSLRIFCGTAEERDAFPAEVGDIWFIVP